MLVKVTSIGRLILSHHHPLFNMKNHLIIISLLNALSFSCFAQPGTLDPTFGIGGLAPLDEGLFGKIVVLSDGKIMAFGQKELPDMTYDILLRRYNKDGTPDQSFGNDGWLTIDLQGEDTNEIISETPWDIIALQDDKILIGGGCTTLDSLLNPTSFLDAFVIRLNYDGQMDTFFGNNGQLIIKLDSVPSKVEEVEVLPDEKIVLYTRLFTPNVIGDYAFIRLHENGSLDPSFGEGGISKHSEGLLNISFSDFCVHPDGEITLASHNHATTSLYHFDNTGKIDSMFGENGYVLPDISWSWEMVFQVLVDNNGKILTCGYGFLGGSTVICICRFLPNGQLDSTFNQIGYILDPIAAYDSEAYSMSIQPDGKILVGGYGIFSDLEPNWLLIRYNPDGTPDLSFGNAGYVQTDFNDPWNESINFVTITPEGKIQVTGRGSSGPIIARYNSGLMVSANGPDEYVPSQRLQLFPNPLSEDQIVRCRYYLNDNSSFTCEIWDTAGRLIYSGSTDGIAGWNDIEIHAHPLPEGGMYVLKVQSNVGTETVNFVKI